MEVKEYLKQIRYLELEIENCKSEIEYMRELATSIPANSVREFIDKSSSGEAPYEKIIIKINELENKNINRIEELLALREKVGKNISEHKDEEERSILQQRYICHKSWLDISSSLGYNVRTIRYKHKKALENFVIK